jgi:excisionase family DNA binding protein
LALCKELRATIGLSASIISGVEDEFVLLSQAAKEAGYTRERLRQLIHANELTASRLGPYWYVKRSDLEAFKAKRREHLKPGPKPKREPPARAPDAGR